MHRCSATFIEVFSCSSLLMGHNDASFYRVYGHFLIVCFYIKPNPATNINIQRFSSGPSILNSLCINVNYKCPMDELSNQAVSHLCQADPVINAPIIWCPFVPVLFSDHS